MTVRIVLAPPLHSTQRQQLRLRLKSFAQFHDDPLELITLLYIALLNWLNVRISVDYFKIEFK
ncbi:hypothetical protein Pat9b_4981 (plasmid) [Pantoea sp. At-9b]|jgi:hypothetical protein|nr:hypothetical protein Pat9b_4981 [Pantoea sp. At-9b]